MTTDGPDRPRRSSAATASLWLLIVGVPTLVFWILSSRASADPIEISYSVFIDQVEAGNVVSVELRDSRVTGLFRAGTAADLTGGEDAGENREFLTYVPAIGDDGLLQRLRSHDVLVTARPDSGTRGIDLFVSVLPVLLLVLIGVIVFRRFGQRDRGLFSFGSSRARLYRKTDEALTFDDVAGSESAKEELHELIDFLRHPEAFHSLGGEAPRGILLVGPPGTGKTMMARAVAGEAEVPFFSITGSDFMEMLVGVGAARVRDLFRAAKEAAPSIIFIDELDSIGRTRGAGIGGGHDEREQTLNQLLSELDGFETNDNVIVMAATNRPDILDPALTRAGRFDRHVVIDLPTVADREAILRVHAQSKPLAPDVDLAQLARGTPGLSGAELENVLNEAALGAARKRQSAIRAEDIEDARDRVLLGLARTGVNISSEERALLAVHEAGHAVVAAALETADPVHKVSIVPRGRSMGATQQFQEHERFIYQKHELIERISVLLAGRTAEQLVYNARSTGAADDIKQATALARQMVVRWGMSDVLGAMATGREEAVFLGGELTRGREFSETTAANVDAEIRSILDQAGILAQTTLGERRRELDAVARRLLEVEEISGEEVLSIIRTNRNEGASGT